MKKMIFLMLVFFLGISASTNAQVNIGSEDGPKAGAVLDLSQGTKHLGLILPNVSLANVSEWQLDEGAGKTSTSYPEAIGTVVFNTNADLKDAGNQTIGKGIFVWVGNGWQAAKSGAGSVLALGFDLSPASSTVPILVDGTIEFTASGFLPSGAAAGVNWVIPSGSAATIQSNTVTTCVVEGLSVGQAILTVTSLDGNVEKLVTIDVQPVPVSGLTLNSEATYTAPAIGGSIQRTATITPANAAEKGVNWTSNHPDVTITPSNPVASGTQVTITVAEGSDAITGAIVTATAVGDGTKTKTITIGRTAASIPVSGLTLDDEAAYTARANGRSFQRTATITPDDATEKGVIWTSNNPSVTITPSGPVASGTPVTINVASGTTAITSATVTATAVGDDTKKKTISVGRKAPFVSNGYIVIDNVSTGFISGATGCCNTQSERGSLRLQNADNNDGEKITWKEYLFDTTEGAAFTNSDPSLFVGANAGCPEGWRLPSSLELYSIKQYFYTTYGQNEGPTSQQVPGFTQYDSTSGAYYITSSYYGFANFEKWYYMIGNVPGRDRQRGWVAWSTPCYVRCVQDI